MQQLHFPLFQTTKRREKTLKYYFNKNKREKKIKINEFKKMEKRIDERVHGRQRYKTREATVGNIFVTFLGANGID
jgi:hypothetical protein